MWNMGSTSSSRSSASIAAGRRILARASMLARIAPWLSIAPLGWPSLPEVYMRTARSLAAVFGGGERTPAAGPGADHLRALLGVHRDDPGPVRPLGDRRPDLGSARVVQQDLGPGVVAQPASTSVLVYPVLIGTATMPARRMPK